MDDELANYPYLVVYILPAPDPEPGSMGTQESIFCESLEEASEIAQELVEMKPSVYKRL